LPDLLPFRGLRYSGSADLSAVTAPPYDVCDDHERDLLERQDPHNAVRLILPRHDAGRDGYRSAADALVRWTADGVLAADEQPSLYAYRMTFAAPDGRTHQTLGVIGALRLPDDEATRDILPHERTLPKARSDRLALLRATRANLDPIWGLSLAEGLTTAIGEVHPVVTARDPGGTLHELAPLDSARAEAVRGLARGSAMVIADGHHRFETACAYRAEHPSDPAAGSIMALVVELSEEQLCVRPIHRLVRGSLDLRGRVTDGFEVEPCGTGAEAVLALTARMETEHALGLVDGDGTALLRPRPDHLESLVADLPAALRDVDSVRFDVAIRPLLDGAELSYRDDAVTVGALVDKGEADAAILLRPVTVPQIRAAAFAAARMPEKTTFFYPKPRTGMVFRSLDG
jgi:uncharacterized protein (DUF1015 family)